MELRELRVFVLAAEHCNFSRAAEMLFLSQSSISKYISSLEAELGEMLFARKSGKVSLTDFGGSFLRYAREIIEKEDEVKNFLRHYKRGIAYKPIILGVSRSLSSAPPNVILLRLASILKAFREAHPNITIKLKFFRDAELKSVLKTGDVDLALISFIVNHVGCKEYVGFDFKSLDTSSNFLACSPLLGCFDSVEELLPHIHTIVYAHDPVALSLTLDFINRFGLSIVHFPCENWIDMLINILSQQGVGIIPTSLINIATQCELRILPLNGHSAVSGLHAVWEQRQMKSSVVDLLDMMSLEFSASPSLSLSDCE